MRAIGYVKNIILDKDTGEVITKEEQKERILNYVKLNDVDLVDIYEDNTEVEGDIMERPVVQKILKKIGDFDTILVERVWCFSRRYKELEPFLEKLSHMGINVVAASTLWDCTSQKVRQYYYRQKKKESLYRKSA